MQSICSLYIHRIYAVRPSSAHSSQHLHGPVPELEREYAPNQKMASIYPGQRLFPFFFWVRHPWKPEQNQSKTRAKPEQNQSKTRAKPERNPSKTRAPEPPEPPEGAREYQYMQSQYMQSQYAVSIYRMYLVLAQHGLRAICAQLQVQCLQYELHQLSDCVTCQEYS